MAEDREATGFNSNRQKKRKKNERFGRFPMFLTGRVLERNPSRTDVIESQGTALLSYDLTTVFIGPNIGGG
jgi:hypothetical protein